MHEARASIKAKVESLPLAPLDVAGRSSVVRCDPRDCAFERHWVEKRTQRVDCHTVSHIVKTRADVIGEARAQQEEAIIMAEPRCSWSGRYGYDGPEVQHILDDDACTLHPDAREPGVKVQCEDL